MQTIISCSSLFGASGPDIRQTHAITDSKGDISGHIWPPEGLPLDCIHFRDARVAC